MAIGIWLNREIPKVDSENSKIYKKLLIKIYKHTGLIQTNHVQCENKTKQLKGACIRVKESQPDIVIFGKTMLPVENVFDLLFRTLRCILIRLYTIQKTFKIIL